MTDHHGNSVTTRAVKRPKKQPYECQKKISAVVACYRDAMAIPHLKARLQKVFEKIGCDYEIIFVNDGSPDDTQQILEELAASDSKVKVICHSRNFGSQSAFTSGMRKSSGNGCVLLDGDLQDPPELIEVFYNKWIEGYDVIYGVRTKREMSWYWETAYKGFYRIFQKLSYVRVPVDAGDFSLMDRKVVNAILSLPERDRFLRGLRAWAGFRQIGVNYLRPKRMFGNSTNNLISNFRWAKKAIFSFSYVPLELISLSAIIISILSALAILFQVGSRILRPDIPHGISTVIVVVLFLGAIQLFSLAFIAEYIGKIFEEVKQRPDYIITRTINFADSNDPASLPNPILRKGH